MTESPQAVVARFYDEVLNQRRVELLPELLTEDFIEHGTPPVPPGIDGFAAFVGGLLEAFPDVVITVHDWVVGGDRVAARISVGGTHRGPFLGVEATGRKIGWTAIHIWRVTDGRLAERWAEADVLGILEQLRDAG